MRSRSAVLDYVLPLSSRDTSLSVAGGKGTNLSRLARAGFPVPDGFIVTTYAYDAFVAANRIATKIDAALESINGALHGAVGPSVTNPVPVQELLEAVSARISALFRSSPLSGELAAEISRAYTAMGTIPVAVRSSATAEDLPDLSFAGQQETLLNVIGEQRVIEAIVECWASLWTPRAIGYRTRNHIPQNEISLAVVVQAMIDSETSGVMFTANPVSGLRSETVVEATVGLGEALVSGRVEPDRFTVDTRSMRIVKREVGEKRMSIRSRDGGGTVETKEPDPPDGSKPAVRDEEVLQLASLGSRVAEIYGVPQDIEWAAADGKLYLLQSRAVTSLFPLPDGMPAEPLEVMFSFAAVQGLMDPITPIGTAMLRQVFASASHIFGYRHTAANQPVLLGSAERLWVRVTPILRNTVGRRIARGALSMIEPTVGQALEAVWDDPRLRPSRPGLRAATIFRLLRFFGPLAAHAARNMIAPRRRRRSLERRAEQLLESIGRMREREGSAFDRLHALAETIEQVFNRRIPPTFTRLVSGVATGMVSLALLNTAARKSGAAGDDGDRAMSDLVLETTRGVPDNPTTQMDLSLWAVAKAIRAESPAADELASLRPEEMAERFSRSTLPPGVQTAVEQFLDRYGARGLAEIDAGRERWRDRPVHLFEILSGYLRIEDADRAPDAVFARSSSRAEAAIATLADSARASAPGLRGAVRVARVRFAAKRARAFLGFREYPKFFAVRMMDIFRRRLTTIGEALASEGALAQPDDLIYLDLSELRSLGTDALPADAARMMIERRRERYRKELLRRQIPRLLLSDGRAFYDGLADRPAEGATGETPMRPNRMVGSPVSPGTVEGSVRVVLDPRASGLQPGEIMVCAGTDPSWTPLFLIAAGLVMEVGGMMTHGAVVAREYGIPAVVGVHEATTRLETGQRIRLDGSSGHVTVLDPVDK